ncbi:phosphoenolpyruvate carboxykinase (ATP) [Endobacter medicaginis]|uniref:Phosphoenolpyruvate carboxykinase (ATP) n=1 Tax=Endobacter medicaginis TaxID=1181271 RepID=A0A850NS97_9PROT|nr:phosphoenolpyruvate carboxykinase (ATP) [Endobacter medicaginis]MBB3172664.1 phosphoenolpyruvate carboxykinase (ATP) [Endobacter medicaginis]MCX5475670.1 phosphoenolpyruvate carboxykinase (ATP) [Endobacter medicaginis]NVN29808.1 phosphoenolpyruvate carboxykinase (ATP) [Endobacter medicaginis]
MTHISPIPPPDAGLLLKADPARALSGTGVIPGVGHSATTVRANDIAPVLIEQAISRGEGVLSAQGAFTTRTGIHTGRSVADKFIVDEPDTTAEVWWGKINQKLAPEKFATLAARVRAYLQGRDLFVQDLYASADPAHRLRVRLVTTHAWHAAFARNMFIRPPVEDLASFEPDYVILHAPDFQADPAIDGVKSSTAIALSFAQKLVVIAGTEYAGEIKKSVFTVMNWALPARGVLPMHCSANVGRDGDTALFFGLSGTGKTTLSSDPERALIGDDEHGWDATGVFNIEGGCYAKTIDLKAEAEPAIWNATMRFGTVLENVVLDAARQPDFADRSLTENTRSCYPIEAIDNIVPAGRGGLPKNLVMLTADAFGVLPPISKLTPAQAMYHFLSGYTAKLAGTEKGLGAGPQAAFSACFGAPFLPRAPQVYGKMLEELIETHGVTCWLLNTGWTGGPYGVGSRMKLSYTRAMLRMALDGSLATYETVTDPHFGLAIPQDVPGLPAEILDPSKAWPEKAAYDVAAQDLVSRFAVNFALYADGVDDSVRAVMLKPH